MHSECPVRDRFDEFRQIRASLSARQNAGNEAADRASAVSSGSPPLWVRAVADFDALESMVRAELKVINKEQLALRRTRFDLEKDTSSEAEREKLRQRHERLIQLSCQLDRIVLQGVASRKASCVEEASIMRSIERFLSARLHSLKDELNASKETATMIARRQEMMREVSNASVGSAASRDIVAQESRLAEYMQQGYSDRQAGQLLLEAQQQQLAADDVQEVLKDLQNINSIFAHVSTMVTEQGTTLDNVACNLHNASVHAERANVELRQAAEHQNSCTLM